MKSTLLVKQLLSLALILCIGCNNKPAAEVDLTDYYHEYLIYMVSPSEPDAICEASFQKGGPQNRASTLPTAYEVFLDGEKVADDKDEHLLYRGERKAPGVFGEHVWTLKHNDSTLIEERINFTKVTLADSLPRTIGGNDVAVRLDGVQDGDTLQLDLEGPEADFKQLSYPVKNNVAIIPANDIKKLKPTDYLLDLTIVRSRPVIYKGKKVGIVGTEYTLETQDLTVRE